MESKAVRVFFTNGYGLPDYVDIVGNPLDHVAASLIVKVEPVPVSVREVIENECRQREADAKHARERGRQCLRVAVHGAVQGERIPMQRHDDFFVAAITAGIVAGLEAMKP